MKTEEEEEERLVPNFNFDDALQVLDSTRISNLEQPWMGVILYGVGVNTHEELHSEVLMTLAPAINEGVACLSFRLEDEEQLVPYGYIGEVFGYKKEARSMLMSKKNDFWGMISREDYKEPEISHSQDFFGGRVHEARKVN
jgi:hypothetical protein